MSRAECMALRRFAGAGAAGLAILAFWPPSAAQAQGLRALSIDDLHATWELLSGYQFESIAFPRTETPDIRRQSLIVGQRLGAAGSGSIAHPRFWSWDLGLNLLATESLIEDSTSGSDRDIGLGVEFETHSRFLMQHPFPGHIFARRKTDIVRRDFARNYDMTTTSFGGEWSWRNQQLPVRVAALRLMNEPGHLAEGIGKDAFTQVAAEVRRDKARDSGSVEYRMYDYRNQKMGSLDYRAHEVRLQHVWFPGTSAEKRWRLESRFRYTVRKADKDRDDGQVSESVVVRWLPRLESRATYQFSTLDADEARTFRHLGQLDTRYQLWQSLFAGTFVQVTGDRLPEGTSSRSPSCPWSSWPRCRSWCG